MDEDEELYRLMNEEDDFYMGDHEDNEESPENNSGCAGIFLLSILLFLVTILIIP